MNPIPLLGGAGVGQKTEMKRKIIPYNSKLKPLAKALRKNMTLAEVLLWNELKQKKMRGYDFDRQKPINNYIVDFYCKDSMLAIEIDGISHDTEEAFNEDIIRQQKLEGFGISFLRFDDREVRKDMENVLREIEGWFIEWENTHPDLKYPGKIYKKTHPRPLQGGE